MGVFPEFERSLFPAPSSGSHAILVRDLWRGRNKPIGTSTLRKRGLPTFPRIALFSLCLLRGFMWVEHKTGFLHEPCETFGCLAPFIWFITSASPFPRPQRYLLLEPQPCCMVVSPSQDGSARRSLPLHTGADGPTYSAILLAGPHRPLPCEGTGIPHACSRCTQGGGREHEARRC